ncbi:MAG: hypothetical protein ACJ0TD_08780 [Arenicellales bacterium]
MLSSITQGGSVSGQCNSWEGIIKYQLSGSTALFLPGRPDSNAALPCRQSKGSEVPDTSDGACIGLSVGLGVLSGQP